VLIFDLDFVALLLSSKIAFSPRAHGCGGRLVFLGISRRSRQLVNRTIIGTSAPENGGNTKEKAMDGA